MTDYHAGHREVIAKSRALNSREYVYAYVQTPGDATRIALALTLIDEASDAELASLVEAKAGTAMVKSYRKEHDLMVSEVAATSGADAARVNGGAA